jgi:hypothetical protein
MPYIKEEDRSNRVAENAGQLNYWLTRLVQLYIQSKGESYQTYNDIMGALEGCKLELYRRKISLYEDNKIAENGDVY